MYESFPEFQSGGNSSKTQIQSQLQNQSQSQSRQPMRNNSYILNNHTNTHSSSSKNTKTMINHNNSHIQKHSKANYSNISQSSKRSANTRQQMNRKEVEVENKEEKAQSKEEDEDEEEEEENNIMINNESNLNNLNDRNLVHTQSEREIEGGILLNQNLHNPYIPNNLQLKEEFIQPQFLIENPILINNNPHERERESQEEYEDENIEVVNDEGENYEEELENENVKRQIIQQDELQVEYTNNLNNLNLENDLEEEGEAKTKTSKVMPYPPKNYTTITKQPYSQLQAQQQQEQQQIMMMRMYNNAYNNPPYNEYNPNLYYNSSAVPILMTNPLKKNSKGVEVNTNKTYNYSNLPDEFSRLENFEKQVGQLGQVGQVGHSKERQEKLNSMNSMIANSNFNSVYNNSMITNNNRELEIENEKANNNFNYNYNNNNKANLFKEETKNFMSTKKPKSNFNAFSSLKTEKRLFDRSSEKKALEKMKRSILEAKKNNTKNSKSGVEDSSSLRFNSRKENEREKEKEKENILANEKLDKEEKQKKKESIKTKLKNIDFDYEDIFNESENEQNKLIKYSNYDFQKERDYIERIRNEEKREAKEAKEVKEIKEANPPSSNLSYYNPKVEYLSTIKTLPKKERKDFNSNENINSNDYNEENSNSLSNTQLQTLHNQLKMMEEDLQNMRIYSETNLEKEEKERRERVKAKSKPSKERDFSSDYLKIKDEENKQKEKEKERLRSSINLNHSHTIQNTYNNSKNKSLPKNNKSSNLNLKLLEKEKWTKGFNLELINDVFNIKSEIEREVKEVEQVEEEEISQLEIKGQVSQENQIGLVSQINPNQVKEEELPSTLTTLIPPCIKCQESSNINSSLNSQLKLMQVELESTKRELEELKKKEKEKARNLCYKNNKNNALEVENIKDLIKEEIELSRKFYYFENLVAQKAIELEIEGDGSANEEYINEVDDDEKGVEEKPDVQEEAEAEKAQINPPYLNAIREQIRGIILKELGVLKEVDVLNLHKIKEKEENELKDYLFFNENKELEKEEAVVVEEKDTRNHLSKIHLPNKITNKIYKKGKLNSNSEMNQRSYTPDSTIQVKSKINSKANTINTNNSNTKNLKSSNSELIINNYNTKTYTRKVSPISPSSGISSQRKIKKKNIYVKKVSSSKKKNNHTNETTSGDLLSHPFNTEISNVNKPLVKFNDTTTNQFKNNQVQKESKTSKTIINNDDSYNNPHLYSLNPPDSTKFISGGVNTISHTQQTQQSKFNLQNTSNNSNNVNELENNKRSKIQPNEITQTKKYSNLRKEFEKSK